MRKYLVILFTFFTAFVSAEKLNVSQVYNPKNAGQNSYVSDVDGVLSAQARVNLNNICVSLEHEVGVEIAVVIVPGIKGFQVI